MLTGAIDVALGAGAAGVFTNSENMWNKLQKVMSIKLPQFMLYLEIFSLSYLFAHVYLYETSVYSYQLLDFGYYNVS